VVPTLSNFKAVVAAASSVLAHTPGLVVHGSKPARVLQGKLDPLGELTGHLRNYPQACSYLPHQAYIGAVHPRELPERPWVGTAAEGGDRACQSGDILPEAEFLGAMAAVDDFGLLTLRADAARAASAALAAHRYYSGLDMGRIEKSVGDVEASLRRPGTLALDTLDARRVGAISSAHPDDEALQASVLLENLANKASAVLAVLHLLAANDIAPDSVDYVIGCSEEAVGDRYQRGGGNMGKAVAASAGLTNASGADLKNFCAAPVPAMVVAASLVASGVFERVLVVGGGSLPKLGMKFQGHLKHGLPVLEDVIGASAVLIQRDDGVSPVLRLDSVGRHPVNAGASNPQIMQALAMEPLDRLGLASTDVDDFASELHNPEITEPQGSGNVPERNYKTLAALAVRRGDIDRASIDAFIKGRGMPGFAPTQGHLASAMCYLPHALDRLTSGDASRVMLLAKGSLFLGRMTDLSDGMSFLLERNNDLEGKGR
jgi:hypothetical protein